MGGPGAKDSSRTIRLREHALATLMELSQSITASAHLYEQVDTLLFGTMGQLGTARSAIWVGSGEQGTLPVLLRCHGFRRPLMLGFGATLAAAMITRLEAGNHCVPVEDLPELQDGQGRILVQECGVAAIALIPSAKGPLGLVAIGRPLDRAGYDAADLQLLETSVGLIGMAVSNARLHGQLSESNRVLRESNRAMEAMDRMKSEFLANVNHELRTPLTVIRASLELLQDRLASSENSLQVVNMALVSVNRLQGMVENLLSFSALSEEGETASPEPVDVPRLLSEIHEGRMPGVTAEFRELVFRCPDDLPPALADPGSLRRIIEEAVTNAAKFTPRGTRIELDAEMETASGPTRIAIHVRDDGPGLGERRLATVFHEFENGGASQPMRPGGIGLGLPLAHRLATRMGGTLELVSSAGHGTCVTVRLPVAERRRGTEPETSRQAA